MRTRAYRRHQRARTRARHLRDYYTLVSTARYWPPPKDIAKRHPLDCGNPRCQMCHYDKFVVSDSRGAARRAAVWEDWSAG